MLTVRFPTGVAVQYNDAFFLRRGADAWTLWTKDPDEGGKWVASIQLSSGAIVEAQGACRVENAADGRGRERALQTVLEHLRWYGTSFPSAVKQLKRELRGFDSHRGQWQS
jgi:hypothetical protein